jgi:hypothetical protein
MWHCTSGGAAGSAPSSTRGWPPARARSHPLRQLRLLDRVALLCARQLALQPTRCQLLLEELRLQPSIGPARLAAASRASISAEVGISPQSARAVSGAHETAPATAPTTAPSPARRRLDGRGCAHRHWDVCIRQADWVGVLQMRQRCHPCRRDHLVQPHAQLGALLMREAIRGTQRQS